MRIRVNPLLTFALGTLLVLPFSWQTFAQSQKNTKRKVVKSNAEWSKILTRDQFAVTRQKATEPAFSGKYASSHQKGTYTCICCGEDLFNSSTKFESGTGWPSFYKPINKNKVDTATDYDLGYPRTEVMCSVCGAHLGHVFDDGPAPTGLRYCMNSVALKLVTPEEMEAANKAKSGTDAESESVGKAKKSAEPKGKADIETKPTESGSKASKVIAETVPKR